MQAEPISNEEEYSKFASSSDRSHVTVRWWPVTVSLVQKPVFVRRSGGSAWLID